MTNLDVSSGEQATAVEHWYRHRTQVENVFRDAKHGAALRHLPSGYPEVNRAWMWGALLAASLTGWLHQLTATPAPDGGLTRARRTRRPGHDRHPAAPADPRPGPAGPPRRRAHPAPAAGLRPARRGPRPHPRPARDVLTPADSAPTPPGTTPPEATLGPSRCPHTETSPDKTTPATGEDHPTANRGFGSDCPTHAPVGGRGVELASKAPIWGSANAVNAACSAAPEILFCLRVKLMSVLEYRRRAGWSRS